MTVYAIVPDDIIVLDDVIALDGLITHDAHLHAYNNFRTAEQIFIRFGMEVMALAATPNSYVLIS
jgi:hypothetical protein